MGRGPPHPAVTRPTPCDVQVNMHKYTGRSRALHMYVVTLTPEVHRDSVFARFMEIVRSQNFQEVFAFDGVATLVAERKFADLEMRVPFRDDEQVVRVEYKNTYDMGDPHVDSAMIVRCMEVVAQFYQRQNFYVDRRRMISGDVRPIELGGGLQVLPGLSSVIKCTRQGLFLNLDMAYGVFFRPGMLLDLVRDVAERRNGGGRYGAASSLLPEAGDAFYDDFERYIRSVRLTTVHRERNAVFRAAGVCNKPASSVEFEVDGEKMTVAAYFAKAYKPLQHPHLPLVAVKKRDMMFYIPLEVCKVLPLQRYPKKLDEAMTAQMIKIAAQRPAERFAAIAEKARELAALKNDEIERFGMAFDGAMLNCRGTMLPPPKISFQGGNLMGVNNGSWNLIGVRALQGVAVQEWKIFTFRPSCRVSPDALRAFCDLARRYGVEMSASPETVVVRGVSEFYEAQKAPFNLVILPDKSAQRYEEVKRVAETYCSCYTQCMVAANLVKLSNPSFVSNLLLKINTKLGGRNWTLDAGLFADRPTILFGIDVSHPGGGDTEGPSIVSIVASMDYSFITYKTAICQQERRQEIVGDLRTTVRSMLKSHFASTRTKPERIIIFRDGVGDSTFDAVFSTELEAFREACADLSASYKPELSFVVAQKRHSVRFSSNRSNLVPGTVVDDIGHPPRAVVSGNAISLDNCVYDFYLVSHNALQGTARPVRYLVLLNESNFSASYWYEMVYALCHLYMRATKSVSIVPPIYYAHLGAARGRCYIERDEHGQLYMRKCDPSIEKTLFYL